MTTKDAQKWEKREIIPRSAYPVGGALVRRKTMIIKREGKRTDADGLRPRKRGNVKSFSKKSKAQLALVVTETTVSFVSLLTLTFGLEYPKKGKITKRILNSFLTWLRTTQEGGIDYCWFLEWQARGAPHIHILLDFARSECVHEKVAIRWASLAKKALALSDSQASKMRQQHRRLSVWEDVRSKQGAERYVVKYALKSDQKKVPSSYENSGRFWGTSRNVRAKIPEGIEFECDEDELREWLALHGQKSANWENLPKILFLR